MFFRGSFCSFREVEVLRLRQGRWKGGDGDLDDVGMRELTPALLFLALMAGIFPSEYSASGVRLRSITLGVILVPIEFLLGILNGLLLKRLADDAVIRFIIAWAVWCRRRYVRRTSRMWGGGMSGCRS